MSAPALDSLRLSGHSDIVKMLDKHDGASSSERVVFSDHVSKINRKGKSQERVLLVTDAALYNLTSSFKCKRRIDLRHVFGVTLSAHRASREFVIHVPSEYDYRYSALPEHTAPEVVAQALSRAYDALPRHEDGSVISPSAASGGEDTEMRGPMHLFVRKVQSADLKEETVTRVQARQMARQQEMVERRRQMLLEQAEPECEPVDEGVDVTDLIDPSREVSLDEFEQVRVLGEDSFGQVLLVRHKATDVQYMMKVIIRRIPDVPGKTVQSPSELVQALQHPFLTQLHYALQSDDKLYFVLSHVPGGELFSHLKSVKRFDEQTAKLIAAEIALALGHLHARDIIYSEVKPENVLLDLDGHVSLSDFGMARKLDPGAAAHTFCATPEYLAPEVIADVMHDKAVDWWGLGVLLYELTVGIPPFYSRDITQLYRLVTTGVLRFPSFVSEDCRHVIIGLLQRDPTKRLGSTNGVDEVLAQPFFADLDRTKLLAKEYEPGFKPEPSAASSDPSGTDVNNELETEFGSEISFNGFSYSHHNEFLG